MFSGLKSEVLEVTKTLLSKLSGGEVPALLKNVLTGDQTSTLTVDYMAEVARIDEENLSDHEIRHEVDEKSVSRPLKDEPHDAVCESDVTVKDEPHEPDDDGGHHDDRGVTIKEKTHQSGDVEHHHDQDIIQEFLHSSITKKEVLAMESNNNVKKRKRIASLTILVSDSSDNEGDSIDKSIREKRQLEGT